MSRSESADETFPTADEERLFVEGIRLFNEREFFACHDVLEELWTDTLGPRRQFLQGLIQSSVALFHFGEGNLGGARKLSMSAHEYLLPYQPTFLGIDVVGFLTDMDTCFKTLRAAGPDWPTGLQLDVRLIPLLRRITPVDRNPVVEG